MSNLITRLGRAGLLRTDHIRRYALQCSLATAVVLILLVALDAVTQTVLIAALALGLVLNEWSPLTLLVVISGVVGLSICKRLVLPILMDLL